MTKVLLHMYYIKMLNILVLNKIKIYLVLKNFAKIFYEIE